MNLETNIEFNALIIVAYIVSSSIIYTFEFERHEKSMASHFTTMMIWLLVMNIVYLFTNLEKTKLYKTILKKFPDANLLEVSLKKKDEFVNSNHLWVFNYKCERVAIHFTRHHTQQLGYFITSFRFAGYEYLYI